VDLWAPRWLRLDGDTPPDNVRYFHKDLELLKGLLGCLPDVLMVTSPPGDIAFKGTIIGRLLLRPVLYDIRDPWTLAQVALGAVDDSSKQYRRQMRMEQWSLRLASRCSVVTEYLRDMICRHFRISPRKFSVAPNGVDMTDFRRDEAAGQGIRRDFGIPETAFVIAYEGIVGGKELDQFLKCCGRRLAEAGGHILFVVIEDAWSGALVDDLRALAADLGIQEILHLLGDVGYSEVYRYLSAADAGLNPLPSNLDYCLPIKTFEYMACELPVISKGPADGTLSRVHRDHAIGPFASDWEGFQHNLSDVLSGELPLKGIGQANRAAAEEHFERRAANQVFLQELERLVHW
jgi:glycosyltransferase involved in cell wall biosynthesis